MQPVIISIFLRLALGVNTDYTGDARPGCIPSNECMVQKTSLGMISRQYICQDDNSVCEAVYDNDDCTGNYLNCDDVTDFDDKYYIACSYECNDYTKFRVYDIDSTDTQCLTYSNAISLFFMRLFTCSKCLNSSLAILDIL